MRRIQLELIAVCGLVMTLHCGPAASTGTTGTTASSNTATGGAAVVSLAGQAAWDALGTSEKDKVTGFASLYLHQSVGQDLEDGAEANGYPFEYYGPNQATVAPGPNGGLFIDVAGIGNGEPMAKLAAFKDKVTSLKSTLKVAYMSFGYADVREADLVAVQNEYLAVVNTIKGFGIRVIHITPPLVFSTSENPPKMAMRTWMLATFPNDVVFDLQDIESQAAGARCQEGGTWRICQQNRSTASCQSKGQGVDGDGAGHICESVARQISKALLYSLYLAKP